MAEEELKDEQWTPVQDDNDEAEAADFLDIVDDDADVDAEAAAKERDEEIPEHDAVQRRIDAITRSRGESDRRAEAAENELHTLKQRLEHLESGVGQRNENDFNERYATVKSELMIATEDGDSARQVELMEKMTDMQASRRVGELARAARARTNESAESMAKTEGARQEAPQAAYNWWGRNRWFNTTDKRLESDYARALDAELEHEGFDKNSQEYYNELDNRLQKKFPALYSSSDSGKEEPKPKPPTAPSSGNTGGKPKPSKDGRIRLTREELNMAKELGLSTEAELREYEKEVRKARSSV